MNDGVFIDSDFFATVIVKKILLVYHNVSNLGRVGTVL